MLTSTIFESDDGPYTLLDLPSSIENSQHLSAESLSHSKRVLLSTCPPAQPYPSTEPKGVKRAQLLSQISLEEREYHEETAAFILKALQSAILDRGQLPWCLPRKLSQSNLPAPSSTPLCSYSPSETGPGEILSAVSNHFSCLEDIAGSLVFNPCYSPVQLFIGKELYHIPARAIFLLHNLKIASCVDSFLCNTACPLAFDLILMDPPWANRSVRHSKAYRTSELDPMEPFLGCFQAIKNRLKSTGVLGIWITNKAQIRSSVMKSVLENGFHLFEEWIWAKISDHGEPLTAIDGLWRKPYEIFLVFRKNQNSQVDLGDGAAHIWAREAPRRVFMAVPCEHSRKPCLKEFIEPLMDNPKDYKALEVFARNLTAGWCSWGDEVLKFNHENHWSSRCAAGEAQAAPEAESPT